MRVPLSWLKDFIELKASPEEVAEILTMGGIEVACVEDPYEELGELITVKILEVIQKEDLKEVCICKVTDGKETFTVLTTAKDQVAPGKVVGVAKAGSLTFSGEKVEEKIVKGIKSSGMFLSPYEAGVGEEKDKILEFSEGTPAGRSIYEVLGIKEPVLELEITPNRGDVLSIIGTARELHALTGWELKEPEFEDYLRAGRDFKGEIRIEEKEGCFRYMGRLFDEVEVGESPFFIKKRLWLCGLASINNVVDITNYVLLELGQPLHAFDWEEIKGGKVIVRRANPGEELLLLDGRKITLTNKDLVIADAERPMVLAGVMGGEETGVSEKTKKVFLEAAWFNPKWIRMSSKRHGVSTESSYRFERGIDPNGVETAVLRATQLLIEVAKAQKFSQPVDVYPVKYSPPLISLSEKKLVKYLGFSIPSQEVESILAKVGRVRRIGEVFEVVPYSYRQDLKIEEDLIEEVARIYGYERIPTTYPKGVLYSRGLCSEAKVENRVKTLLSAMGFYQVITYSFISPDFADKLMLPQNDVRRSVIKLSNPISVNQSIMRTTLIPGLLDVACFNFFREVSSLKVFEVGRVFFPAESETGAREELRLGILLMGFKEKDVWYEENRKFDIFDLKGVLEEFFDVIGAEVRLEPYSSESFLKKGRSFDVYLSNEKIGFAGEVKELVLKAYDIKPPVLVAEVDLEWLKDLVEEGIKKEVKKPPKYPSTFRDVTCIMDKEVKVGDVINFVLSMGIEYLERVACIKIYEGAPIPEGKKSVSLRFWYRAEDRTLTDEEVNKIQERVAKAIFEKFNAQPR